MKKIIPFLTILLFFSCKDLKKSQLNTPAVPTPEAVEEAYSKTHTTFDYEVREMKSGEKMILIDQELPEAPECILKPGDTLRLCMKYNEKNWKIVGYYNGWAEVDHCEFMTDAVLISIKKINCRIFKASK